MDLILKENSDFNIENKQIEKILSRIPEINRANQTVGKSDTQTTSQLMTLNMSGDEPYRHLRQISAQIEKKRFALEEAHFKFKKENIKLKQLKEKNDELSIIEADEIQSKMFSTKKYIEGAVKQIGMFQDAYDEIRKSWRIPEKWDEVDAEKAEIRNHIKFGFRGAFQEMMATGMIGRGSAEYLEQFGIHPQSARKYLHDYIIQNEKMMDEGQEPTIEHFYNFLDLMVDKFQNSYKLCMKRIGLKTLVRQEWCYREIA